MHEQDNYSISPAGSMNCNWYFASQFAINLFDNCSPYIVTYLRKRLCMESNLNTDIYIVFIQLIFAIIPVSAIHFGPSAVLNILVRVEIPKWSILTVYPTILTVCAPTQ